MFSILAFLVFSCYFWIFKRKIKQMSRTAPTPQRERPRSSATAPTPQPERRRRPAIAKITGATLWCPFTEGEKNPRARRDWAPPKGAENPTVVLVNPQCWKNAIFFTKTRFSLYHIDYPHTRCLKEGVPEGGQSMVYYQEFIFFKTRFGRRKARPVARRGFCLATDKHLTSQEG